MPEDTVAKPNGSLASQNSQRIVDALEDNRYEWRTLEGVSEQTGIPIPKILETIEGLQDIIIRSSVPDPSGRDLYTTRKHFKETQGILTRILSAVSDKVA